MRLYLVQHGEAVSKEIDPDRPLSEGGRQNVERLAAMLERTDLWVRQVVHSGKARARETAEILAAVVSTEGAPIARRGLDPKDPVSPIARLTAQATADTMLVGHLPFMMRLAALLLTADETGVELAFQPGSVVCMERDEAGTWRLLWMIRPELLGS